MAEKDDVIEFTLRVAKNCAEMKEALDEGTFRMMPPFVPPSSVGKRRIFHLTNGEVIDCVILNEDLTHVVFVSAVSHQWPLGIPYRSILYSEICSED